MRGMVPLPSPVPLITRLPAVYQEDDFVRRFTSAFDDLLAPVFVTLDGLPAYVDPALAPDDFVDWLLRWVAVEPDEHWPVERRRLVVAAAVELHRLRGTVTGIREIVRLVVDGEVEVMDNGGTAGTRTVDGTLPGSASPWLHVRVRPARPGQVTRTRLDTLIAGIKPAGVPHTVEVVEVPDAPRT